ATRDVVVRNRAGRRLKNMGSEHFYVGERKPAKRWDPASRPDPRGRVVTGRIATMLVGQGHGFIRLADTREVYFHRADLQQGTVFNDLSVGATVTFELLEDTVSGARALRVVRQRR